jgi:hypothetical protein
MIPSVFPDWSPYGDLDSAAKAYLRDPDVALEALHNVLGGAPIQGFTLERFVNEHNGVWQEVVVCDGARLLLWHGEDLAPTENAAGSMISSLRVVPLSAVVEVGCRRRLNRLASGQVRVDSVDVYVLLSSLDEANGGPSGDDQRPMVRQDALRFGKTLEDGGPGQIARLEEFAYLIASLAGRPIL